MRHVMEFTYSEPIIKEREDTETDRQRQTETETDRQSDRQSDRQTYFEGPSLSVGFYFI